MKRTSLFLSLCSLCVLTLVGCASAPAQTYRPRNYDGPSWQIECEAEIGLIDMLFAIQINGETIIEAKFSDFKQHEEYSGHYQGHAITASLTRLRRGVQVMVFVDGERAATF